MAELPLVYADLIRKTKNWYFFKLLNGIATPCLGDEIKRNDETKNKITELVTFEIVLLKGLTSFYKRGFHL